MHVEDKFTFVGLQQVFLYLTLNQPTRPRPRHQTIVSIQYLVKTPSRS